MRDESSDIAGNSIVKPDTAWHALDTQEVLAGLKTRTDGLSESEAADRAARFGPNALAEEKREGLLRLALRHLANPIIYVLCAAVAISLITGHFIDAAAIFAVIVLNTALGMAQEARAERALAALKELAAPRARVVRDGEPVTIPAAEVVPGDILELETGDRVAADARLLSVKDIQIDESALTGESEPITKNPDKLEESTGLADRKNMVWMSTVVTGGRARAVVVTTGMNTTVGNIAEQMRSTQRPKTPLQRRINRLGTFLGFIAVGLGVTLFVVGLLRLPGEPVTEMLLFAVAAAVSAVPSGLPAAISVTLALGVRRMAARNAIIRQLPAVETLGSTTVICSDKTGTLTRNEMTVTRVWVAGEPYQPPLESPDAPTRHLLKVGALASNARIIGARTDAYEHVRKLDGSATEKAILALSLDNGLDLAELNETNPRLAEVPFSSSRKWMAVLVRTPEGRSRILLKGAPERVLGMCDRYADRSGKPVPVDDEFRRRVQDAAEGFAADALRLVAGAYQDLPDDREELTEDNIDGGFVLLGLWGMVDPPRDEAGPAVKAAHGAGIRTVMITGDHAATAAAIARQVGIAGKGRLELLTGHEMDELSESELTEKAGRVSVFARVSPAHKLRILNALTGRGEVVAMTGDGVNDAPALKAANIGIAMGKTGTEVAKEAGDMILTDDNFATIVSAVEEGRVIFHNIRRVVSYLMGTNFGEMITFASCILIGLNKPLTAVMVLWVNLVTDGACTIPLGLEPGHGDVLGEPPRSPKERLVNAPLTRRVAQLALTMATVTTVQFFYDTRVLELDPDHARTIAFTTLAAFQWFQAFALRSTRHSIFKLKFTGNRWLLFGVGIAIVLQVLVIHTPIGPLIFKTVPLTLAEWGRILALSSSVLIVDEIRKLYGYIKNRGRNAPGTPGIGS